MVRQVLVLAAVFAVIWALGSDEPVNADVAPVQSAPVSAATVPTDLAKVPVQIGFHRGYDRVVFDWTSPVDYSVKRLGDTVELRFDGAADIDLADRGDATVQGKKTTVSLAIDSSTRLRHFRSGTKVVLDILTPTTPAAASVQLADAGAAEVE